MQKSKHSKRFTSIQTFFLQKIKAWFFWRKKGLNICRSSVRMDMNFFVLVNWRKWWHWHELKYSIYWKKQFEKLRLHRLQKSKNSKLFLFIRIDVFTGSEAANFSTKKDALILPENIYSSVHGTFWRRVAWFFNDDVCMITSFCLAKRSSHIIGVWCRNFKKKLHDFETIFPCSYWERYIRLNIISCSYSVSDFRVGF